HEIKEMRDLPRVVADTPVGKDVQVTIIRKGKEDTKTVKLGRLEDGEKKPAVAKNEGTPEEKSVVKKTLGLDLSNLTNELRKRYKIKDNVKGVVITAVEDGSAAADKRLSAGGGLVGGGPEAGNKAPPGPKKKDKTKKNKRTAARRLITTHADGRT